MMRDSIAAEEALKKAQAVGQYYGFRPFAALAAGNRGARTKFLFPTEIDQAGLDPVARDVAGFLKQMRETAIMPSAREPIFVWHSNIAPGRPAPRAAWVQFHALGADRAIADAVLIRAVRALVADYFKVEPEVRINSMGDRETRARFARELGLFFKKRGATLPEACVNSAKRDVFEAVEMLIAQEWSEDLPSPTDHLSDQSRKRFEELLEYLEATETPYTLAPNLISRGMSWSETCFEIRVPGEAEGPSKVVAWGSRYGELAKPFFKQALPAVGAQLRITTTGGAVAAPAKTRGKTRIAFVHIGEEAKHASMKLADEFRRAHVSLEQMIGVESLGEQMRFAEALNPPYLLIMGRKEALEHSAVLRNRATQEETILPLLNLSERLKTFA